MKVTMQSPVNQLSETATGVREILLFKKTCLTHTLGFLCSLFLSLKIIINNKPLSGSIFIFELLIFPIIYFTFYESQCFLNIYTPIFC